MNLRDMKRLVRVAKEDADLVGTILGEHDSMLSPAERAALYQLIRMMAPSDARIADWAPTSGTPHGCSARRSAGQAYPTSRGSRCTTSSSTTSSPVVRS